MNRNIRDRIVQIGAAFVIAGASILTGCAHRAPDSIHNNTALISGHNTVHATHHEAMQTVLVEAAAITVDHGYRYFELMGPVRPGAEVSIRVYENRESPSGPNIYDADTIAAGQLPTAAR